MHSFPAAVWLEKEARHVVNIGALSDLLWEQCKEDISANTLSATQEHLVGYVCKLPDVIASRMGREVSSDLLPQTFFSRLATCVYHCLERLHSELGGNSFLEIRSYQCMCVSCAQPLATAQYCLWLNWSAGLVS